MCINIKVYSCKSASSQDCAHTPLCVSRRIDRAGANACRHTCNPDTPAGQGLEGARIRLGGGERAREPAGQTDSARSHRTALGPLGEGAVSEEEAALHHRALGVAQQRDSHDGP